MNVIAALTSDRRLRATLLGSIVIALIVYVVFMTFRLRATYRNSAEVAKVKYQLVEMESRFLALESSCDERLSNLEVTVFADLQPKVKDGLAARQKTVIQQPTWSANRDKEIREQIRMLQRQMWRLEYER